MSLNTIVVIFTIPILMTRAFFHEPSKKIIYAPESVPEYGLFGYSISYEASNKSLIVSAPRADNVGQIFSIGLLNLNITRIKYTLEDMIRQVSDGTHNYNDWMLGATVSATNGFFVTCAPRYRQLMVNSNKGTKRLGNVGVCYIKQKEIKLLSHMKKVDRMLNTTRNVIADKFDTFGWSIHITQEKKFLVGGPALNFGRVLIYEKPNVSPKLLNRNILYSDPVRYNFGYSIVSGNFFSSHTSYAISTTYGDVGFPKIYLFNENYEHINTITYDEVGLMFGACLCAVRLGGQYDSLLVGAPAYVQQAYFHDTGAVFIYVPNGQTSPTMLILKKVLTAYQDGGYFGMAMTNLGDMDGDHKDEVAIAAPYEDDGAGAVYIYTGAALFSEANVYRHRIKPEGFRAFGLSLATLWDYDNNGCNELAIGSPDINKVLLLNTFASVTVTLKTKFPRLQFTESKAVENIKFQVLLDIIYPEKPNNLTADINVTVELTDPNSKFLEETSGKYSYIVSLKDRKPTYNHDIEVEVAIAKSDVFQVISYKITAKLETDPTTLPHFDPNRVLLSERSVLSIQDSKWSSSCGAGKTKCVPKLVVKKVQTSMPDRYIIGSTEREYLNITITNVGDKAYDPCATIQVIGARILQPPKNCIKNSDNELLCNPGEFIVTGKDWNILYVELEMNSLNSINEEILIICDLHNHCGDVNEEGERYQQSINLFRDFEFTFTGRSNPDDVVDTTVYEIKEFEKKIDHVYTITNNGVTNWMGLQCQIVFKDLSHVNLLNSSVLVYPEKGAIQCILDVNKTIFTCNFPLNRHQKAQVHVTIELLPESFNVSKVDTNVTITTDLYLMNTSSNVKTNISASLHTILNIKTTAVALWTIIVSSLFGVLLLAIIAFVLYKKGFFKRNNRKKTINLRASIKRQSQYMPLRQSRVPVKANPGNTKPLGKSSNNPQEHDE